MSNAISAWAAAAALATGMATAQAAPQASPPAKASPAAAVVAPRSAIKAPGAAAGLPNGQVWHYTAEWRLFDAGKATLKMEPAGREQRVVGTADATGVVALLYHVRDRFESFFDPATFCSRSITKRTEEGFRRIETNINFDQVKKKSYLFEKNLKKNTSKNVENDTPGCVTDVLTAIYYIRSLPLQPGSSSIFPLNDGGKTVDVKMVVEGREEVKVPAGTFQAVRVQSTPETGSLKGKGQLWVWYSDDARRTPVQMKARLFWGTLTFKLERVETVQK